MSSVKRDHEIKDMTELNFEDRGDLPEQFKVLVGCNVRLLHFPAGKTLELHSHTGGDVHKFIIKGQLIYNEGDSDEQIFSEGQYAIVHENTEYRATARKETFLLLAEPPSIQTNPVK